MARLQRQHGPLPHTVTATSGGGGKHFYFAHPGGLVHNKVGLFDGIDLRGDGGCIVTQPSQHPSGRYYEWLTGREPASTRLARLPHWLLLEITSPRAPVGHPLRYWRQLVSEGVPEGERNSTIASFAGHLLWHGIDSEVTMGLLLCWNKLRCHPPLSDSEVIQTVESITRLHKKGLK